MQDHQHELRTEIYVRQKEERQKEEKNVSEMAIETNGIIMILYSKREREREIQIKKSVKFHYS